MAIRPQRRMLECYPRDQHLPIHASGQHRPASVAERRDGRRPVRRSDSEFTAGMFAVLSFDLGKVESANAAPGSPAGSRGVPQRASARGGLPG